MSKYATHNWLHGDDRGATVMDYMENLATDLGVSGSQDRFYEQAYVDGYNEHIRTVIAAMRNEEAAESVALFLQSRLQDEYDLHLGNDHAMDMASDLLFALIAAIRLEEPTNDN